MGDLKELSAKLSISKMTGELSKSYSYKQNYLLYTPICGEPVKPHSEGGFDKKCGG